MLIYLNDGNIRGEDFCMKFLTIGLILVLLLSFGLAGGIILTNEDFKGTTITDIKKLIYFDLLPSKGTSTNGLPAPIKLNLNSIELNDKGDLVSTTKPITLEYNLNFLNACYKAIQNKSKCVEMEEQRIILEARMQRQKELSKAMRLQTSLIKPPEWSEKDFNKITITQLNSDKTNEPVLPTPPTIGRKK